MAIQRRPLRDDVHQEILSRLLAGTYASGARLKDTALAYTLGVSRTPVREALVRLAREGFLEADMGRGFTVRALNATEVREVYPLLWTLERLALQISADQGPVAETTLARLDQINAELGRAGDDARRQLELDLQWHDALVSTSPNQRLLSTLATLRDVIVRYEHAFLPATGVAASLAREHREIAHALGMRTTDAAAALLEKHWRLKMDGVLEQLAAE